LENATKRKDYFSEAQLRKVIDAYTELGSMNIAIQICLDDYECYDPFLSYYGISDVGDKASDYAEFMEMDLIDIHGYDEDVRIDIEFIIKMLDKYIESLLPKSKKSRSQLFEDLLDK
jgi:hypothetical protein